MRSFPLSVVIAAATLLPAIVVNAAPNPFIANNLHHLDQEMIASGEIPAPESLDTIANLGIEPSQGPTSAACTPLQTELLRQGNSCAPAGEIIQLAQTAPVTPLTTSPLTTPIPGLDAPESLNPSADPLLFPTIPQEVQINLTEPITLEQAIILARRNNPQITQAQLEIDRAQARLRETYAAEFPTGTVSFDFTRSDSANSRLNSNRIGISQSNATTSAQATLQLDYSLYTGGRRPATIALAAAQFRTSRLALESQLVQLRLDVANDYYSLQQADAQLKITQSSVTQAQRSLRDAQLREQAGVGTQFEVLQADVALANAVQDERNALSQQLIARRQLAQRLNLPQTATVITADEIRPLGDWTLSLEDSIVLALKNRSEIEQQLVAIEQSEAQQRIAVADTLPQVNLFANYNVLGNIGDGLNTAGGGSVGIRAQWTFFDAGAARSRIAQQEANIATAQSNFTEQRNLIRFQVEQSFYNLQANRDNITTAGQAVIRANEGLRLARLRFQAGVGTQSEVITAQTDLTRAEVNQLNAIVGFNRSLATLQRSVSNLDGQLFDNP